MNCANDVMMTSDTLQRTQSSFTIDSLMSTAVRYETPPMTKMMTSPTGNTVAMTSSCGLTVSTPSRHMLNGGLDWSNNGKTRSACPDYFSSSIHSTNAAHFSSSYRHHLPQQPLNPRETHPQRHTLGTSSRQPHLSQSATCHVTPRLNSSSVSCRNSPKNRFAAVEKEMQPQSPTGSSSFDTLLPPQYAANLPLYAAWLLSERGNTYLNSLGSDNSLLFPFHKRKRFRTSFNPPQLVRLEEAFQSNRYMVGQERRDLAESLGLTETQIKVWFQNRRTKQKKDPSGSGTSSENGNDDDEILNIESSSSRDCRVSMTSSSSRSEGDDVDVIIPRHHLLPGLLPATTGLLRALEPINHAQTMMSCSYRMM